MTLHWRYCSHRTLEGDRPCWKWQVYDGYCRNHNATCFDTCHKDCGVYV